MQILIDKLKEISGGRVLDIATGRGNFVHYLLDGLNSFESIIGIDYIDQSILDKVKMQFPNEKIRFITMDASNINFAESSFDTVSLSNSLHHLKDMDKVLEEAMRVLKPGGTLILNEMICDYQSTPQMTYVQMHHWWAKLDMLMGKIHYETFPRQKVMDIVKGLRLSSFEALEFNDSDNPMDKESLQNISKIIDEYIERAKGFEIFDAYRQEGEEIRRLLYENGVNGATQIIIIGKK